MASSSLSPEFVQVAKQASFDVVAFAFLFAVILAGTWHRPRALRLGAGAVFFALVAFCARGMPEALAESLLAKARNATLAAQAAHCIEKTATLVVLGGGVYTSEVLSVGSQLRVVEAAKIVKQASQEKRRLRVILSGGGDPGVGLVPEAPVLKRALFLELGEQGRDHDFFLEERSRNTYQNALYTRELLVAKQVPLDVVLVTGAVHFERSQRTFEKAGFTVCAAVAPAAELRTQGLASFRAGALTVSVLNEYIGMMVYRFKGWN